jgi:hypothetical protein
LRGCLREPMPHHESPIRFEAEIAQLSKHLLSPIRDRAAGMYSWMICPSPHPRPTRHAGPSLAHRLPGLSGPEGRWRRLGGTSPTERSDRQLLRRRWWSQPHLLAGEPPSRFQGCAGVLEREMPVRVERDGDLGVAQQLLHRLGACASVSRGTMSKITDKSA